TAGVGGVLAQAPAAMRPTRANESQVFDRTNSTSASGEGRGIRALIAVRTALPPRAFSLGVAQATWLVPRRGITAAGQRRNDTGLRCSYTGRQAASAAAGYRWACPKGKGSLR